MENMRMYSCDEVLKATLNYFGGDELAANVWMSKYAMKDGSGEFVEKTPADMHRRLAKEFARIESKYEDGLTEDEIFEKLDHFRYIVPQGSPMMGIGNNYINVSLSNCFAAETKIITSEGIKPIGKLAGSKATLLSNNGKREKWVESEIRSFGKQNLMKITLKRAGSNKVIYATPEHRWFVSKEPYNANKFIEKQTKSLTIGNKLQYAFAPSISSVSNCKPSWFGIAHGITYGDGKHVKNNKYANSITLCGKKDKQLTKYFLGAKFSSYENACNDGALYCGGLPNFFKKLPSINENRAYLLGWLMGFFAADGTCASNGNIRFNSSKLEDLLFVKDICSMLGIGTFEIKEQSRISNLNNKRHTMYHMHVMPQHLNENFFLLAEHKIRYLKSNIKKMTYWNIVSVEPSQRYEEVYCAVVPEYHNFTLEDNILTGNCVVVDSPADTISSIVDAGKELANLFKRRCGVGLDISELRPDGTPVNNSAGTTTGAWSFADFYSYVCRMIGQNNRRGALMITMDVRHPDIYKFVCMKEDLTKVTGANVSVRITDEFMNAVEQDGIFTLRWPIDSAHPKFTHEIKAKELWETIVGQATKNAEPGILMWDNILRFMPAESYADVGFKTISTNPCSEIPLSAYDSCRLISINLKNFVVDKFTDKARFDFELFANTVSMAQRLSDDLVELEIEKLTNIIEIADTDDEKAMWRKLLKAAQDGRRTGLGTHGLADALACLCQRYDSDEALETIDRIYETLKLNSYKESINLAKQRGAFPIFDWDKEKSNEFIQTLPEGLRDNIATYGRRNIANLTNAPTGSVSLVSQTSSGLEPVFKNSHVRRKKRNHNEEISADDFVDAVGDRWKEYHVFHHNVLEYVNQHGMDLDKPGIGLPDFFVESDSIDWLRRVEIQGVIQKHIDHAISSTINLPKGTDPELVGQLYFEGWKRGLKGITVYVDGSRTGVLVSEKEDEEFSYRDAVRRPEVLPCHIHQVKVKGEKWTILVGLMDGKPYEVFGGLAELIEIPAKHHDGILIKASRSKTKSRYDLQFGEDGWLIKDVTKAFDNINYQVHTRMVSLALRHGAKPSFLVEQLQKDPDGDLTSFSKVLARVLKRYIESGTKVTSDKICPSCGSEALIYQEGCITCQDCGYAKCG